MKVKSEVAQLLSHVLLLATPGTAAYQAPLSMAFSRQEYWSGALIKYNQPLLLGYLSTKILELWSGFI